MNIEEEKEILNAETYIGELKIGIVNLTISLCEAYKKNGLTSNDAKAEVVEWFENKIIPLIGEK